MFGKSRLNFDVTKDVFVEMKIKDQYLLIKYQVKQALDSERPAIIIFKNNSRLNDYLNSKYLPQDKKDIIIINQHTEDVK